ncbi:MAG: 50S ribosomal protein L17 [Proteobacteria bacterium]|nr:50S ribosomal protein L17 [Pseudomonadota bacterium]
MRHQKTGRQLGRNSSHRKAMFRNMVVSLLDHESIKTTDAKAKELRKYAERLITLAKKGDLSARRRARVMVNDKDVLNKLFDTLAARYKDRPGGYTRIVKLGLRPGDNAPLSVIQLVQEEMASSKKTTAKKAVKPLVKKQEAVEVKADGDDVAQEEASTDSEAGVAVEATTTEATEKEGAAAVQGPDDEAELAKEDK